MSAAAAAGRSLMAAWMLLRPLLAELPVDVQAHRLGMRVALRRRKVKIRASSRRRTRKKRL